LSGHTEFVIACSGSSPVRPVLLVVYDRVRLLDVAGPLEVFAFANGLGARYQLSVASLDGRPVRTTVEVSLPARVALKGFAGRVDTLIVPGGPGAAEAADRGEFLSAVRDVASRSSRVASVCTGAFVLGGAGLLGGRRATTHWAAESEFAQRFPEVALELDAIFVRDGHVLTSAGVTAGIDLALSLVEEDYGAELARRVAKLLVVFMQRPGGQSQFSVRARTETSRYEPLRELLDAVAVDPGGDHSASAMAQRAMVSERHLARLFVRETGMTPAQYVEEVRVEAAQSLLERGDESLEVVAQRAGFGSPETMRRAFLRVLGITPGSYRARFRSTGPRPARSLIAE
jgi:transcriptional regulator GlxA family with amidase domain